MDKGIDASQIFVETLGKDTWINSDFTPYELYLKMLYEFFEKDLNLDKQIEFDTPSWFMDLKYQEEAVTSALRILNGYGGLFIADFWSWKNLHLCFDGSTISKNNHILILCPPILKEYWEETFQVFKVACKVESKENR